MIRPIAAALGAGFIAIGIGAVLAPRASARQYGLRSDDPTALAWVRATGARDAILGAIVLGTLGDPATLRRVLAWSSLAALADACAVASVHGLQPQHAIHLGGFAALLVVAFAGEGAPPTG